jgi:pimeloyl-ACP methyl ester carboxylesterase
VKRILKWAAVAIGGCLALLLVVCVVWEQLERRKVVAAYPAPGLLVDIGGRRIQIECRGAGSPTVLFETGLDYFGSLAWAKVYDRVAEFTHACAYSRAGIVWSDDKSGPHDGLGVARDLHATLAAAGEKGPFVMVGLSLGGPYSTIYTGLYGDQVAGLVYVDASHPDQMKRFEAMSGKDPRAGTFLTRLGGKLAWTGIPRLLTARARNRQPRSETLSKVPAKVRQIAFAFYPTSFGPMQSERDAMPATFDEAGAYRNLGARPVIVLTRGQSLPDLPKAEEEKWEKTWLEMQKDMATWSSRSTQRIIRDAHHYIPNEDPDAVIAAIREVVDTVRSAR